MELLNTQVQVLTQTIYTIQLEDGFIVNRVEFTDDNGKVIDSFTRSKDGEYLDTMDEIGLMDEIDEFIDSIVYKDHNGGVIGK